MRRFKDPTIIIVLIALVLMQFLEGGFSDMGSWIMTKILILPGIIIGLSFHEFAHGIVSYKLGDPTPKLQGRLTINPMAHMDPFGFIALLFAGFGWGIPVQIDPRYYKHRRRDELLVALAGVTMNLLIAIVFAFIVKLLIMSNGAWLYGDFGDILFEVLSYVIQINIVLMIFNLLPIPPLDGFGIITQIFNLENTEFYWKIYDKGFIILMILILIGATDKIMTPAISAVYGLIVNLIIL